MPTFCDHREQKAPATGRGKWFLYYKNINLLPQDASKRTANLQNHIPK